MYSVMKKRTYGKPQAELVNLDIEQLMIGASPGVGGGYDPGKPIDGKGSNCFEDEEDTDLEQGDCRDMDGCW